MSHLVPADGAVLERILDGTHEIWSEGLPRREYSRWWRAQLKTSWGTRRLRRWALVDGDEVLSSAKVYDFDAVLDGRAIRIAGLGAVFTPRRHRGRGSAAELIAQILARATSDGADLALLFSEIGPEYYARLGFETIPISDVRLAVVEDLRRGAPATMVRSGDDRDLADIAAMDAERALRFRFHLARDPDVVKFAITKKRLAAGLAQPGAREVQFFVAEEGASAAAYVVIAVKNGEWTIDACGDRDPSGARIGAILQVLIAREPSRIRPTINAWWPASLAPPQITIVDRVPSKDVAMIRPLSDAGRPARPLAEADILYWRGDAF